MQSDETQRDAKRRAREISAGLYANSNHLARCTDGGGGGSGNGGGGDGGGPARPLADVFLRSIGSIPDRFSNESRGLNAERTRARSARGTRADTESGGGDGRRGTSRSKGWSSPRVDGANSNNQACLGERHRTVVTRANPKYCYPPGAFTSFSTAGFLAVRREASLFMENRRKLRESVPSIPGPLRDSNTGLNPREFISSLSPSLCPSSTSLLPLPSLSHTVSVSHKGHVIASGE